MDNKFLPINKKEMIERGWSQPDFVLVTGDAYVDHPSFGAAIIGRFLELYGYKVCILSQPDWRNNNDFKEFGRPRLGFLITGGNIESMVNHYSVSKKRRKKDYYTPNGEMGKRPDRATIVYSQVARSAYPHVPIILGGIEASLRRLAHYDYWDNKVRRSILLDSKADLLIYGMGEKAIIEVAESLDSGLDIKDIIYIKGTVWKTKDINYVYQPTVLPSYEDIVNDKVSYAKSFKIQTENTDAIIGNTLVEPYDGWFVVQNPPQHPLPQNELDDVFRLPFSREIHPFFKQKGHVPAIDEVKYSLISNRGCAGGCSFCALTFHQGRRVQARSHESIISEAEEIINDPNFKGYIHDVGGPTANFRNEMCDKQIKHGVCKDKQCLWPTPCKQLKVSHDDYLNLLRKLRKLPNVKKVFVRSGLRYDYIMYDKKDTFFNELVQHHISGQLKVAPEHVSDRVLQYMGKPSRGLYDKFVDKYHRLNKKYDKDQFLVPYLMSSHPGSDLNAAIELAEYLRDINHQPEQVQDFYPTPGTLSTCMYYTGIDPRTMKKVYVPRNPHEKAMQRALMQYRNPRNYDLVYEALKKANRMDLIGYDRKCLIRPRKSNDKGKNTKQTNKVNYKDKNNYKKIKSKTRKRT